MTNALLAISIPSAAGSLESYIQSVKAMPVLSAEEEQELALRLKRDNDVEAARMLVVSHLRVVVNIARGYMGYGLPQADLIQEGNIGLMKAVRRFDGERGVRLVSFAIHWIRAEMHEYILRNWRLVKVATTKAQRKLFFNLRSMKKGLGYLGPDEVNSIAKDLGVKPEEVVEMESRMGGQDISMETHGGDEDEGTGPIAYLAADATNEPAALLEQEQTSQQRERGLSSALQGLDDRSRRIIEARWLTEDASSTLHELAAEYGVSAERIRQIEQKALQKMKTAIVAEAT
ncbi:RNA polymerase sigma-32 subunit RpoH [Sulfuricella denitrificans skB26]|uniref:RNA polymerase sigma factor RpoH n=1 Tax=Sulfuricella denitrificans (strain DSM 22764 / NBRC 105220 / skB26) TaxID=1163617 RepID=S6AJD4_SULDS|nr:RNA polymerase sigma factor RpoH [Sulfuricella denitrificans]BAN36441.1 RNA polymerase sigma-32 subunit RpoH [Sulfuricella denitrificans skB26]